jgi:hypothetical protein
MRREEKGRNERGGDTEIIYENNSENSNNINTKHKSFFFLQYIIILNVSTIK